MLIVEDGTGLPDANSYASLADAARYFGLRGNDAWFGGEPTPATATLSIAGMPLPGSTVTIADTTYTLVSTLDDQSVPNQVMVGDDTDTRDHLIAAINQGPGAGTTYSQSTRRNYWVSAAVGGPTSIDVTAIAPGPVGNRIVVSTSGPGVSWGGPTLTGGSQPIDEQRQADALIQATTYIDARFGGRFAGWPATTTQALAFPRLGIPVACSQGLAMPPRLISATIEYAVRALSGPLAPDPVMQPGGYALSRRRRKLGPIENEWEYNTGSGSPRELNPWRSYPLPDSMMSCMVPGGLWARQSRVIRS